MSIRTRYDNDIFKKQKLSNGISVYLQQPQMVPDEEGIIIAFLPFVGSCLESPGEHGLAHFFEHILFDVRRLNRLNGMAGEWNGSTSGIYTEFNFRAPKDFFRETTMLLSDTLAHPPFSNRVVKREQKVIAAEFRRKNAEADCLVASAWSDSFFGSSHPLGHFPIGKLEVIESMTAEKLQSFYHSYYHAGNIRLLCGAAFMELGEERVLSTLEKYFGNFPVALPVDVKIVVPEKHGERAVREDRRFGRDELRMLFYGNEKLDDSDYDVLDFLADSLCGMHSPLVRELRIKRGWIYESSPCSFEDTSFGWNFQFQCASLRRRFPRIQELFWQALKGLDKSYLLVKQRIRQLSRKKAWAHPIGRCNQAISSLVMFGKKNSKHYWEGVEDAQTVDHVLSWRDRLLQKNRSFSRLTRVEQCGLRSGLGRFIICPALFYCFMIR